MNLIAQTTQPMDWTARLTLWGAIATAAITVATAVSLYALAQFKKIRDAVRDVRETANVNTQNTQTLATNMNIMAHAQNATPGPPESNVPSATIESTRVIAQQPTIPTAPPIDPDLLPEGAAPVVVVPTAEAQAKAFDAASNST